MLRSLFAITALTLAGIGCSSSTDANLRSTSPAPTSEVPINPAPTESEPDELFPDVVAVRLIPSGADDTYTVAVTLSSPYDSPARYADAWRLLDPDGEVLAVRELAHDHAGEQPFTRSVSGVVIAGNIAEVTAEGRDQLSGWGGATVTVAVPS